jgi:hypothetical protein
MAATGSTAATGDSRFTFDLGIAFLGAKRWSF